MQFLKDAHLNVKHHFEKGGKLEFFYPLWEAQFTGLFTPGDVTRTASHVRDGLDNKRLMITVVFALLPCMVMATWNTGYFQEALVRKGMEELGFKVKNAKDLANPFGEVFRQLAHGSLVSNAARWVTDREMTS